MYILHHAPFTRSFRVLWTLEELQVPYELDLLDIRAGGPRMKANLKRNAMGKVPALTTADGAVTMSESCAICAFLADAHPAARLAPPPGATQARARYQQWLFFTAGVMDPGFMDKLAGRETDRHRGPWGSFEDSMRALVRGVPSQGWLCGEEFTVADLLVGLSLIFGARQGVIAHPALLDFAARCRTRPAFAAALAIDQQAATQTSSGAMVLADA